MARNTNQAESRNLYLTMVGDEPEVMFTTSLEEAARERSRTYRLREGEIVSVKIPFRDRWKDYQVGERPNIIHRI